MSQVIEVFLLGPGLVGGTLLEQIKGQQAILASQGINLKVCVIANSRRLIYDSNGIDLSTWKETLAKSNVESSIDFITEKMKSGSFHSPIFVDCTASITPVHHYLDIFRAGLHIVVANKRANAQPYSDYLALREVSNSVGRRFLYETNVGAGLPIIDTLQNLVKTGDELIEFSGICSGSLSFIFGLFEDNVTFSDAINQAKALGYTEPDPRDDLLCEDVVRKLIILAREAGFAVNREDIDVSPILPEDFDSSGTVEQFLAKIPQLNDYFAHKVMDARSEGKVLRLACQIKKGKSSVGVVAVNSQHPMYSVKNGDQIFIFKTKRYSKVPLVVKGTGAGADVTAAGVFGDILRLASWNPIQRKFVPSVENRSVQ